ncbi:MAG: DUF6496 domain-containing protein [Candidatus Thorarchaeota archaeon]
MSRRSKAVREALKHPDKPGAGARKRKHLSPDDKIHAVMAEYERGTLRSGSGEHVTSRDQAIAIAMSEAGRSRKKHHSATDGKFLDDRKRKFGVVQ